MLNKKNKIKLNLIFSGLILAVVSLSLFFCVTEVVLGVFGLKKTAKYNIKTTQLFQMGNPLAPVDPVVFGNYERDKRLFWKLKQSDEREVNSKRYRGAERDYNKKDSVYRIIVLGDSCAYGIGVKYSNTYSYLLEEKLNQLNGIIFEIIDAGVPGYTSLQGLRYLKHELIKYHPDMVLIGFGFNDLCEAVGDKDSEIKSPPEWSVSLDDSLSKFKTYILLKQIILKIKQKLIQVRNYGKGANRASVSFLNNVNDLDNLIRFQEERENYPLRRVPPADFSNNIKEIIEMGNAYKFKVVLLTLPSVNGNFGYGPMLRLLALKYNVKLIDLIKDFEERLKGRESMQKYFLDNNHYNEKGHLLVADLIYDKIKLGL